MSKGPGDSRFFPLRTQAFAQPNSGARKKRRNFFPPMRWSSMSAIFSMAQLKRWLCWGWFRNIERRWGYDFSGGMPQLLNTARHLGRMAGMILAELTTKSSKQSQLSVFQVFLGNFKDFLWFFCFWCFSVNFDPICVQLATPTGRIIFQVAWNMTCWYIFGLEQISPSKLLEACMSFMVGLIHN